jgi:hypothetical protein
MTVIEHSYQTYLSYMEEYEEEYGHYPMALSNDQWVPYSLEEFKNRFITKNKQ